MNPMAPQDLYEAYQLGERLWEVDIKPGSQLANVTLQDSGIGHKLGLSVLNIYHGRHGHMNPEAAERLHAYDKLLVLGREERIQQMCDWGVDIRKIDGHEPDFDLTEVIIPPRSAAKGKSLADLQFRSKYHLTAVALWREGRSYRTDVGIMPLEVGDALLMIGAPDRVEAVAKERDYLVLHHAEAQPPLPPQKGLIAVAITILVLMLSILEIVPAAEAMLIGAAAVALTGCINLDDAYRGIEWRVVFLIAGMLPLSIAMVNTGLAERMGSALVEAATPFGPMVLIGALFLLAMAITQVIGGQVTSLLIGPIAISSAIQLGVNPQAVAVAVAIGCSTAFLTPIAHPVNVLMMGPGGYTFRDFVKVGAGMTLVTLIALMVGMFVFWKV
jgi:di/tricarboxylate transporter